MSLRNLSFSVLALGLLGASSLSGCFTDPSSSIGHTCALMAETNEVIC